MKSNAQANANSTNVTTTMLLGALLALATHAAFAHDAWVLPGEGPEYQIEYGHKKPDPYAPEKVKHVKAWDRQGKAIDIGMRTEGNAIIVKPAAAPALMTVEFDNGYWTTVDGQSRNVGKTQAPTATQSSHPLKFGKTVLQWTASSFEPVGQRIEVVPQRFDGAPRAGMRMTVRVLVDGKPIAGLPVLNETTDEKQTTDAQGLATLKTVAGLQRIGAEQRTPLAGDPNADTLALSGSLTFVAR